MEANILRNGSCFLFWVHLAMIDERINILYFSLCVPLLRCITVLTCTSTKKNIVKFHHFIKLIEDTHILLLSCYTNIQLSCSGAICNHILIVLIKAETNISNGILVCSTNPPKMTKILTIFI